MIHSGQQAVRLSVLLVALAGILQEPSFGQTSSAIPRVHSSDPAVSPDEGWIIGDTPLFEAGRLGNPDSLDFYRVRGLVRFSNGTTVVANSGQLELVFLSSNGSVISTPGGRGEGPGEFENIGALGFYRGDSVWVMDYARGALSFFDREGHFGRSVQLQSLVPRGYWPAGALPDGRIVVFSDAFMIGGGAFPQDSTWLYILDLETAAADTVGRFPKSDAGNPPGSMALGANSALAVGEDHFYWGRGDAFEFRQFDVTGAPTRIISKDWEPFRVTDRAWRRHGEARIESLRRNRTSNPRELIRRAREENERIEHAEFLPAFIGAIVDSEGNLWVREYPLGGVRTGSWFVFTPSGRWHTTVELPDGFRLHAAGPDWVLGIAIDEFDVEVVQLLPLIK